LGNHSAIQPVVTSITAIGSEAALNQAYAAFRKNECDPVIEVQATEFPSEISHGARERLERRAGATGYEESIEQGTNTVSAGAVCDKLFDQL
jgi:hypothetical protein